MELNDLLRALRTKWRYVLAGLLAGLAVAVALNAVAVEKYVSSTQFFVKAVTSAETRDPNSEQQFSQQRIVSYVQLLTGRELAQLVVDELSLDLTAAEVSEMITATPLPDTVILEVEVTDTSPQRAQLIASSVVANFTERVREVETSEGAAAPAVEIRNIEPPTFEPEPVSPAAERNLALGAALGLLLGLALALMRVRTDRSLRTDEQLAAASGAAVMGRVSVDRQLTRRHVSGSAGKQSAAVEDFRTVRVNLLHAGGAEPPRTIVVAGPQPGDGATTVAVNLALSLAHAGARVLLVDADLRRPRVARQLSLSHVPGLAEVLAGQVQLQEVARRWGRTTLAVLDAGMALPADPAEALGSPAMRALLEQARGQYDSVIIDAPPLLPVVDGAVLSSLADGCLVVARYARTTREQLGEATDALTRVHAQVLGLVLNRVPGRGAASRARRGGYTADADRRRRARPESPDEDGEVGAPAPGSTAAPQVPMTTQEPALPDQPPTASLPKAGKSRQPAATQNSTQPRPITGSLPPVSRKEPVPPKENASAQVEP